MTSFLALFACVWIKFCKIIFQELERKAAELQRKEQEMRNMQYNGKTAEQCHL